MPTRIVTHGLGIALAVRCGLRVCRGSMGRPAPQGDPWVRVSASGSVSTATAIVSASIAAVVWLTGFVVTVTVLGVQQATGIFSPRYMRLWYRDGRLKLVLAALVGTPLFSIAVIRRIQPNSVSDIREHGGPRCRGRSAAAVPAVLRLVPAAHATGCRGRAAGPRVPPSPRGLDGGGESPREPIRSELLAALPGARTAPLVPTPAPTPAPDLSTPEEWFKATLPSTVGGEPLRIQVAEGARQGAGQVPRRPLGGAGVHRIGGRTCRHPHRRRRRGTASRTSSLTSSARWACSPGANSQSARSSAGGRSRW